MARPEPKPLLLKVGMYLSGFLALLWGAFIPLAAFGVGSYAVNDQPVSPRYFLTHLDPLLLPFVVCLACIAAGLRARRHWTRPLMLGFWAGIIVVLFVLDVRDGTAYDVMDLVALLELVAGAAISAWYLYRKANVVAYFRSLDRARGVADGSSDSTPPISSPGV